MGQSVFLTRSLYLSAPVMSKRTVLQKLFFLKLGEEFLNLGAESH